MPSKPVTTALLLALRYVLCREHWAPHEGKLGLSEPCGLFHDTLFLPMSRQLRVMGKGRLPGPRIKPRAWQALVLAMALVLSCRDVAPAI